MNYTKPDDLDHHDKPEDWLNSSLMFAAALGHLLEENTGVVVDVKGDMINPVNDSKKIIVFNKGDMIVVDTFEQNLPAGSRCIIQREAEKNGMIFQ